MVLIFLFGLFLLFCASISSFGAKWGYVLFPIYLIVGLFLFSVYSFGDGHYYIGAICSLALISYSLYLFLDFKIGERSEKSNPAEWLTYLAFFPICIAVISLFCLPKDYISFQGSNTITENKSVYYTNCTEAKYMGVAPIYRGEPGYRSELDRDNDGVACE